jgi:hypothetical protein
MEPMEQPVPESNKTTLGLYATPTEAYGMWKADTDGVHILDVRTFEEYVFGGHPEMAQNVPLVFPRYKPGRAFDAWQTCWMQRRAQPRLRLKRQGRVQAG